MRSPVRESDVEEYLIRRVKECGGEVRKLSYIGRHSATDRLVLLPYFHAFAEIKRPGLAPTDAQLREHDRLRKAGCNVWVLDCFERIDKMLEGRQP